MIYLLLAIISSALVSIVMRLSSNRVKHDIGLLAMNYFTALCISLLTGGASSFNPGAEAFGSAAILGSVNGVLYVLSLTAFQGSVKKNGVVLSSVFMKLGILVPMLLSVCFFGEIPSVIQAVGFVIALAAIIIINSGGEKGSKGFNMGLVFLLILSGSADAMAKIFEETSNVNLSGVFFTLTFLIAVLVCLVRLLKSGQKIGKNEIIFGCLIGIPNCLSAKFLLPALERMPAVIVYPTYSVGTIMLVTLVGVAAFGEKLQKKQWLAMLLILAALVLLNI